MSGAPCPVNKKFIGCCSLGGAIWSMRGFSTIAHVYNVVYPELRSFKYDAYAAQVSKGTLKGCLCGIVVSMILELTATIYEGLHAKK